MEKLGYKYSPDSNAELQINFNHPYRKNILHNSGNNKCIKILLQFEPDAVYPSQYKKKTEEKYNFVIDVGGNLESSKKFHAPWPYAVNDNPSRPTPPDLTISAQSISSSNFDFTDWNERNHFLIAISANKVSPTFKSNYLLRKKLYSKLEDLQFKLYGEMWADSILKKIKYRISVLINSIWRSEFPNLLSIFTGVFIKINNYNGPIDNKHKILRNAKYSIVIENSSNKISEKLFDSLINGCIPIYVGPDLSSYGLKGLAIECPPDVDKILKTVSSLESIDAKKYLKRIKDFIYSDKFLPIWAEQNVLSEIANQIMRFEHLRIENV